MYFPKNKENLTMIIKIFRENGKSALHSPSPPWPFRGVKMHRKKVYIFNFTRKKKHRIPDCGNVGLDQSGVDADIHNCTIVLLTQYHSFESRILGNRKKIQLKVIAHFLNYWNYLTMKRQELSLSNC